MRRCACGQYPDICARYGHATKPDDPFGPGHPEYCPQSKDVEPLGTHCEHWWDAEPCCWCGTDDGHIGDGACTCDGACDGTECRYCAQDPKGRCPAIW